MSNSHRMYTPQDTSTRHGRGPSTRPSDNSHLHYARPPPLTTTRSRTSTESVRPLQAYLPLPHPDKLVFCGTPRWDADPSSPGTAHTRLVITRAWALQEQGAHSPPAAGLMNCPRAPTSPPSPPTSMRDQPPPLEHPIPLAQHMRTIFGCLHPPTWFSMWWAWVQTAVSTSKQKSPKIHLKTKKS